MSVKNGLTIFVFMNLDFIKNRFGLQLLLLAVIVIVSNMIFGLLAMSYVSYSEQLSFAEVAEAISGNLDISTSSRYTFFILSQIGTFLLPALVFAGLVYKNRIQFLKLNNKPANVYWFTILFFTISCMYIMGALADLNMLIPASESMVEMEEQATEVTKIMLQDNGIIPLAINILFLALVPAIAEEFFFRGVLQKVLISRTNNALFGILITAFLFSFIHFQFQTFIPRFFMGIALGYLLLWSKNLMIPILAHFLNNALSILAFYYLGSEISGEETTNWTYLLVSLPVFIGLSYLYYKTSRKS